MSKKIAADKKEQKDSGPYPARLRKKNAATSGAAAVSLVGGRMVDDARLELYLVRTKGAVGKATCNKSSQFWQVQSWFYSSSRR